MNNQGSACEYDIDRFYHIHGTGECVLCIGPVAKMSEAGVCLCDFNANETLCHLLGGRLETRQEVGVEVNKTNNDNDKNVNRVKDQYDSNYMANPANHIPKGVTVKSLPTYKPVPASSSCPHGSIKSYLSTVDMLVCRCDSLNGYYGLNLQHCILQQAFGCATEEGWTMAISGINCVCDHTRRFYFDHTLYQGAGGCKQCGLTDDFTSQGE